MTSPVSAQANKLWQLLTAPSTATAYQQAFQVTKTILSETLQLLWLLLCLVLVAGEWFWQKSIATGKATRNWVNDLTEPKTSMESGQTLGQMWESFAASSRTNATALLAKAKQQLDLPVEEPAPPSVPAATPIKPTPAAPPAAPPVEVTAVEPVKPTESTKPAASSSATVEE